MNSSYGLDTYRSHDLNIAMRTSSGDVIKMDFANEQSASLHYSKDENSSKTIANFSSMQSFQFSMQSNGIDAQDQKEIDAFMKQAKPQIDAFLEELSQDAPNTPVTKTARNIVSLFDPNRPRSEDEKNAIKTNIVKMFDNALNTFQTPKIDSPEERMKKILDETQKLLEKTLKEFDNFGKNIYA